MKRRENRNIGNWIPTSNEGKVLAARAEALSSIYDPLKLDVAASASAQTNGEIAKAGANTQLILAFGAHLPKARMQHTHGSGETRHYFATDSLLEAKLIRTSIVWHGDIPHYVIGAQKQSPKHTNLLLLKASQAYEGISIVATKSKHATELDAISLEELLAPLTEDEKSTDTFIIGPAFGFVPKVRGRIVRNNTHIDDAIMSGYEVHNHLFDLAIAFGKESYLDELFAIQESREQSLVVDPSFLAGRLSVERTILGED